MLLGQSKASKYADQFLFFFFLSDTDALLSKIHTCLPKYIYLHGLFEEVIFINTTSHLSCTVSKAFSGGNSRYNFFKINRGFLINPKLIVNLMSEKPSLRPKMELILE